MRLPCYAWVLAACFVGYSSKFSAQLQQVRNQPPAYPLEAKAAGIEGQVKLHGIITKQGGLRDLTVTKGPRELRQAAIDAVKNWIYKPYLLDGVVTEVDTTIVVNFTLGNAKEKAAAQAKARAELAGLSQPTPAQVAPAQSTSATPPPTQVVPSPEAPKIR